MSARFADDLPVHVYRTTQRCDVRCRWRPACGGREGRDLRPGAGQPVPPSGRWRARLSGGNALRYGDLVGWAAWAREHGCASLEVEGPAHGLATPSSVQRLRAVRPDRVILSVCTLDGDALEGWLGSRGIGEALARSLDNARTLEEAPVFSIPINSVTIDRLVETVLGLVERFGVASEIFLRRAPLTLADGAEPWSELDALGVALVTLRSELDDGVVLRFDREAGYAACMVDVDAHRRGLFPVARGGRDPSSLPTPACESCGWSRSCAFDAREQSVPTLAPLDDEVVLALQKTSGDLSISHVPGAARFDRASIDVPDLLCFEPFTSLVATDPTVPAVPCALSWVRTKMTNEELAAETGLAVSEIEALDATSRAKWGYPHFTPMNEDRSLREIWNSPLLRVMRRQMARPSLGAFGPTDRCRPMCRVVLGVEERQIANLARPDDELAPAVAANRQRLLDELRAGRDTLEANPLKLVFGVASRCNISCSFCVGPEGAYGELSERRLEEIVALLPTLMNLVVIGPGEPLMSQRFPVLLGHIADSGYPSLSVSLTTNGTLVTPSWVKRHANVRWGNVRISLNAGSAATHERMTGKAQMYERVIRGIEALVEQRERTGTPTVITLSCVLSELILGDLGRFAEMVDAYGTDIVLEPMNGNRLDLSPYTKTEKLTALRDECRELASRYQLRNPPIARAFAGMVDFAEQRLDRKQLTVLPHH